MSETRVELSVVVPAYNEEGCIARNLRRVHAWLRRKGSFELIVVDDGSADGTASRVAELMAAMPELRLLREDVNRGKGRAVRTGVRGAAGRMVAFLDADLCFPVSALDDMIPWVSEGFDCVIGSRRIEGSRSEREQSSLRRGLGKVFSALARFLLVPEVRDVTCGLKLFTRRAAEEIFARQTIDRWGFDAEILFLARHLGFAVKEVPLQWAHRPDSKVRILRDVAQTMRDLCVICANRARGLYGPPSPRRSR